MKNRKLMAAFRSMEQPSAEIFRPLAEQQAQAKQGTITAPTGADANLLTLGASTPVRDTLAGVVRSALQLASALKIAILNFGVRKAIIVPTGTNIATVTGATNMALEGTFTKVDPTATSSAFSYTVGAGTTANVEDAVEAMIANRAPKFTVESLTNALEDLQETNVDLLGDGTKLVVIQDQAAGEVRLYSVPDANAANAHTAAVALAEDVQFVQTLDAGGAAQFGE